MGWRLTALLGLVVSLGASAKMRELPPGVTVLPLAGITNDRDASVSRLNLMVDARAAVRGLYVETDRPAKAFVYPLRDIESREGVVLGEGSGVKAILLRGTIDSGAGRGSLTVKYLTNGLLMTYRECRLALRKSGAYDWRLINAYDGAPVTRIEVKTWVLGIATLKNVCPPASG